MTVTIAEAATLVGVSEHTVRAWIKRGHLRPVRPRAKPVLLREDDVVECHHDRQSKAWHDRLDEVASRAMGAL